MRVLASPINSTDECQIVSEKYFQRQEKDLENHLFLNNKLLPNGCVIKIFEGKMHELFLKLMMQEIRQLHLNFFDYCYRGRFVPLIILHKD